MFFKLTEIINNYIPKSDFHLHTNITDGNDSIIAMIDAAYKKVLESDIVGLTERQAAAIGEKAAYDAGAEYIVFSIFASGDRTNTVVGRPSEKVIEKNDMIMYALAVQYEGYIASDAWPFVAGGKLSKEQSEIIYHLINSMIFTPAFRFIIPLNTNIL